MDFSRWLSRLEPLLHTWYSPLWMPPPLAVLEHMATTANAERVSHDCDIGDRIADESASGGKEFGDPNRVVRIGSGLSVNIDGVRTDENCFSWSDVRAWILGQ